MEKGLDKLYNELKFVQERRSKLAILKLGFVAGFFGIGSLKLGTNVDAVSRTALYLVPLVAVLFDLFGIASTITIKKLEAFLRERESETTVLNDWKSFSQEHCLHRLPEWCNQASHFILTATAFIVPAAVLWKERAAVLLSLLGCDPMWILLVGWPFLLGMACLFIRLAKTRFSKDHWLHRLVEWCNLVFLLSLAATPFLVLAALLWSEQTSLLSFLHTDLRWIPFVGPLILWSAFRILECLAKRKLERNDPKSGSHKNNQNDTIPPQKFISNDCDPQGPQGAPA